MNTASSSSSASPVARWQERAKRLRNSAERKLSAVGFQQPLGANHGILTGAHYLKLAFQLFKERRVRRTVPLNQISQQGKSTLSLARFGRAVKLQNVQQKLPDLWASATPR